MRCVALLFVLLVQGVCAETIQGKVIRITEGDTLTIFDASAKRELKIRLAGIDAPEREQPHFETSRQNLAGLAYGSSLP